jgi:hypothetical protein
MQPDPAYQSWYSALANWDPTTPLDVLQTAVKTAGETAQVVVPEVTEDAASAAPWAALGTAAGVGGAALAYGVGAVAVGYGLAAFAGLVPSNPMNLLPKGK